MDHPWGEALVCEGVKRCHAAIQESADVLDLWEKQVDEDEEKVEEMFD